MRLFLALLVVSLLCLASVSEAASKFVTSSSYRIDVGESQAAIAWSLNYSTTMKNLHLTLTFPLPPNSTLISVTDALGQINDTSVKQTPDGPSVTLTARNGEDGGPIALEVQYLLSPFDTQEFGRLRITQQLCLAVTDYFSADVILPADSMLIASSPAAAYGSRSAHFGTIDQCITLAYMRGPQFEGADGYAYVPYTHYDLFTRTPSLQQKESIGDVDSRGNVLPGIAGYDSPYSHWAVIVSGDGILSSKGEEGLYTGAGVIYLREGYNESYAPILAHETMHGFNSEVFQWNNGKSFWFEEGTADYAAHIMALDIGLKEPDIFVRGSDYYSSSYSELAEYYRSNNTYMEGWNFETLDTFSYDYSQFIIRAYVDSYGTDALRQVYKCLSRVPSNLTVSTYAKTNELVLGCMSIAAGNISYSSILYPGRDLFWANEPGFEYYSASIGRRNWKGSEKPLPSSASDLPPLPYEKEAQDALDSLASNFSSLKPFSSEQAKELYNAALARYGSARDKYQARDYREALNDAEYASALLRNAIELEAAYSSVQQNPAPFVPSGQQQDPVQQNAAPQAQQSGSCLPMFALAGILLLASWRRF